MGTTGFVAQPAPTSKASLALFCCLMKASTVRLPSLATAVPSQQRGDRTDGPKLRDKSQS